jgi:LuxR family transcriptional regulator, maltose regulon positive regulatory protein
MVPRQPPPLPSTLVHRPRLLELVDAGVRGPLTVLSGPAGAGKTTLLSDWAHARSAADDDSVVWETVAGADEAGRLLRELSLRAARTRSAPLVAILDGLGPLPPAAAPQLAAAVGELVRERPDRLRVVLATRGEPPLPLARLRLDAAVAELGPGQLAFTWEEARSLLAPRLRAEAARARWEQVEGWAAGLACEPAELAAFLERELLEPLGPELRDFLLRVSVAEVLTPALAAELSGRADAGGTLDRLARSHALVVPLDRNGDGYRLARPLRDALRRLRATALPDAAPELHRRAADWHARAGDPLAAARHALAAGEPRRAADLLAACWLDLLAGGRDVEMAELLAAMPPQTLADDPELRLAAGALATARRSVAQALDRSLGDGAETGRGSMAATLAAARLRLARLEGDLAGAGAAAAQLTDGAGDPTAQRRRRTLALQQLGVTALIAGEADDAAASLEQAAGLAQRAGFDRLAVTSLGLLAGLDAQRGRLRSAQAWGERAVALAAVDGERRPDALAPAHLGLAVVAWMHDERCAAEAALRRAQEASAAAALAPGAAPDPLGLLALRVPAAWLAAAGDGGDPAAELARLDRAADDAQEALGRLPPWIGLVLDEARVRLLLALGRTRAAAASASAPRGAVRPERLLLGARVALAREDAAEAQRLSARFLAAADARVRPVHMLEGMLLQAATAYELGTVWDGLGWLERAVAAAAEERFRRPFADGGRPVRAMLQVLARRGPWPPVGFVAELLRERPADPGGRAAPPGGPELSGRERAILRYLPSLLSKREIAGELGVSANTVKTHVSSIYRKLDVGSREEAVARARELGLLGGGSESGAAT